MRALARPGLCFGSLVFAVWAAACGGESLPAASADSAGAPGASGTRGGRAASGQGSVGARSAASADDDPEDANDPATMKPMLAKGELPPAPARTVSDGACWHAVALTGDARRDYASLIAHCGTPTGSVEYAKPAVGRLDHIRDQRDTFIVFLRGGLCYRFFGVADATIPNLDILIERNGALQAEDLAHGPVAIINTDQAWCMDTDAEYRFVLQVRGEGGGRYVFGIWARKGS